MKHDVKNMLLLIGVVEGYEVSGTRLCPSLHVGDQFLGSTVRTKAVMLAVFEDIDWIFLMMSVDLMPEMGAALVPQWDHYFFSFGGNDTG